MGQVAFDTLKFVETLETAGLPKDQAKAISLAVRESHEAADVVTKRDLDDTKKEVLSEITAVRRDLGDVKKELLSEVTAVKRDLDDVRKEIDVRFEKTDAQIDEVRKDLSSKIAEVRKDLSSEITKVRKDLSTEIANFHREIDAKFDKVDARFEKTEAKTEAQIALLRKDMETLANGLIIKLSKIMLAIVGISVTIAAAIVKLL